MKPSVRLENDSLFRPEGFGRKSAVYFGISFAAHIVLLVLLVLMPAGQESRSQFDRFESLDVHWVSLSPQLPNLSPGEGGSGGSGDVFPGDLSDGDLSDGAEQAEPFVAEADESHSIPVKSGASRSIDPSSYTLTLPESLSASEPAVKAPTSGGPSDSGQASVVLPEDLERQDGDRRVADAVQRMARETAREDRGDPSVRRRIEEMADETEGRQRQRGTGRIPDTASRGEGGRPGGISSGAFTRIQIYQSQVTQTLRNNWVFQERFAGDTRGLESRVVMQIMPDGEIRDVWFDKRSGDDYLDESAYKTVMKSDPLPPLPDGLSHYQLLVGFTPGGLQ